MAVSDKTHPTDRFDAQARQLKEAGLMPLFACLDNLRTRDERNHEIISWFNHGRRSRPIFRLARRRNTRRLLRWNALRCVSEARSRPRAPKRKRVRKILVRQIQLGMRERRIAVEKNVDIDEARPPADRRFPAHVDLNRIGRGKDFERPQAGFSYSAGIGEKVLLHVPQGAVR